MSTLNSRDSGLQRFERRVQRSFTSPSAVKASLKSTASHAWCRLSVEMYAKRVVCDRVRCVTGTWFNGFGLNLHTGRAVIIRVPNLVTANGAALYTL